MTQCQGSSACESAIIAKYSKINAEQRESVIGCKGAQECVDKANEESQLLADYAKRANELLEKARTNGGLSPEDQNELSVLQVTTIQLEADRTQAIHNALMSGDSEEAKQLAINSLAQAFGTSAAGIAGGVSKAGSNSANATAQVVTKNMDPGTLISRQNKNEMSGSQVKRLVKDMKENGFDANEPVDVAIVNGKAIIIDGHHRAEAAAKAGIKDIPVRIHEVTKEQGDQLLREAAEARVRY